MIQERGTRKNVSQEGTENENSRDSKRGHMKKEMKTAPSKLHRRCSRELGSAPVWAALVPAMSEQHVHHINSTRGSSRRVPASRSTSLITKRQDNIRIRWWRQNTAGHPLPSATAARVMAVAVVMPALPSMAMLSRHSRHMAE